jgi:hypothetical protein
VGPSGTIMLTIRIQTRGNIYNLTDFRDFRSDNCQEGQDQNSKG